MRRTVILGLAAALALAAIPAGAQKKAIQREIAFAKGLASEFGFVGLGNQVLEDLLKRKDLDQEDIDRINLEKCDLLIQAARAMPKIEKKMSFYEQATTKIEEVLTRFKGRDITNQARMLYAKAALNYGQVIAALMEEEADPQKKEALRQKAEKIYRGAIKACNDAKSSLSSVQKTDPKARNNYLLAWMHLGELQKGWASIAKNETERKTRLEMAKDTLENFIYEVGDDTPAGAHCLILYAQCSEMEGNKEDALSDFAGTKDSVWDTLTSKENPPDPNVIPILVPVMEEAYYNQIRLLNKLGKTDEAIQAGDEMVARISQLKDIRPSKPYGLEARIEYAKALFASGEPAKIDKALKVAKEVADLAGTSYIRTEAQKLINRIIQSREAPTSKMDPDILYQAAEGSFRSGNPYQALANAKKILRALKTQDQKKNYGIKVYKLIGRILTSLGRYADASFAYGTSCELFGDLGTSVKYVSDVKGMAILCKNTAQVFRNRLPQESKGMVQSLLDYSNSIVMRYAPDQGDYINLSTAKDLLGKKRYDEALSKLDLIKQTSDYYEEAIVQKAKVYLEKKDYPRARKILKDYLEKYIPAHQNLQGKAEAIRANMEPLAWYTLGIMAYKEAMGDAPPPANKPDPSKWAEVLKIFQRMPQAYSYNQSFVENGWYYTGVALTAMGKLRQAMEAYKSLKAANPKSRLVPYLALDIFRAHLDRIRKLEKKNKVRKSELERAYREALAFADEYIRGNPLPQYAVLYESFNFALDLGEQEKALQLYGLIEKYYDKDPKYRGKIIRFVKPRVVEILQKRGDFNRAKPLVEELLGAYKKGRWPLPVLWLGVFEYGGWLEVDGPRVKEILGLNQPLKALEPPLELMPTLYKTVQAPESKFSLQWYAIVAEYTYLAYRAGQHNEKWAKEARTYLRVAESIDNFGGIKNAPYLLKGKEKEFFDRLAPALKKKRLQEYEKQRRDLMRIFQYLKSKLGG